MLHPQVISTDSEGPVKFPSQIYDIVKQHSALDQSQLPH